MPANFYKVNSGNFWKAPSYKQKDGEKRQKEESAMLDAPNNTAERRIEKEENTEPAGAQKSITSSAVVKLEIQDTAMALEEESRIYQMKQLKKDSAMLDAPNKTAERRIEKEESRKSWWEDFLQYNNMVDIPPF